MGSESVELPWDASVSFGLEYKGYIVKVLYGSTESIECVDKMIGRDKPDAVIRKPDCKQHKAYGLWKF